MALSNYQNRKYSVAPYNPTWVETFRRKASVLAKIFKSQALQIEHIGSTAVPGLAGKPTIDILILVRAIEPVDALQNQLEKAGYHSLGEYISPGARLFVQEEDGTRICNIHVYTKDHPHVLEMLALRDYLRTHPTTVKEYSDLKEDLARRYPNDYSQYRKYKDAWMEQLKTTIKTQTL